MAFASIEFYSDILKMETSVWVIVPEETQGIGIYGQKVKEWPVLWLLHGMSDDQTIWMRRTSVERYAAEKGLMVVMPDGGRSRYQNMKNGPAYYDYLTEELPEFLRRLFPKMSEKRDRNFIAGLSMGGGGAMWIGLKEAERFCAIGNFSSGSVIPLEGLWRPLQDQPEKYRKESLNIYGVEDTRELAGSSYDMLKLIHETGKNKNIFPDIYFTVGNSDQRMCVIQKLIQEIEKNPGGNEKYWLYTAPGDHEWNFWDRSIRYFLEELSEKGRL